MKNTATGFETGMSDLPFKLINVEEISLDDEFLTYKPFFHSARDFKNSVIEALTENPTKKFYMSIIDPSENEDGTGICLCKGKKPALGHSFNWHKQAAMDYMPNYGSRLCKKTEWILFVTYLMKKMAESGWDLEELWRAATMNSKKLGQYQVTGVKPVLQNTGSKGIYGFYDLANTVKLLASDRNEADYYIASGAYYYPPDAASIANVVKTYCPDEINKDAVGRIVLEYV